MVPPGRPIHFINLSRAADRRAFMERQGEMLGIDLLRFEAHDAASIDELTFRRLSANWERPMTRNELAAFLSHRALWKVAADSTDGIVILEDDAVLSRRFPEAVAELPQDFDLVNLETVGRRKFFKRRGMRHLKTVDVVPLARDKSGAGAYFLTPAGARRLLERSETQTAPVDAFMFAVVPMRIAQAEPALTMQVHLLAERGLDAGISTTTSIHAPRQQLPMTIENWRFHRRRMLTQGALVPLHLRRVIDLDFRPTRFDVEEFRRLLPIELTATGHGQPTRPATRSSNTAS